MDLINQCIAKAVIDWMIEQGNLPNWNEDMKNALKVRPPCRFEEILVQSNSQSHKIRVILDVAHNPEVLLV